MGFYCAFSILNNCVESFFIDDLERESQATKISLCFGQLCWILLHGWLESTSDHLNQPFILDNFVGSLSLGDLESASGHSNWPKTLFDHFSWVILILMSASAHWNQPSILDNFAGSFSLDDLENASDHPNHYKFNYRKINYDDWDIINTWCGSSEPQ